MSIAQFTLHGAQCQWLIAHCVIKSGMLSPYLKNRKILFKGSSTVSCLTTLLCETPLRICGRFTKGGMKGPHCSSDGAHLLLYESGAVQNVDQSIDQVIRTLGPEDLFITGANALDAFGHAAMLIGSPGGGGYGACMPFLYTEGIRTLVLSSIMKLIPGDLTKVSASVSRRTCGFAFGMACSLAPIPGEIITETQAIESFANVNALIFAKGGFYGAEGSVACQVEGPPEEVEKVLNLVEYVKSLPPQPPVEPESAQECSFPAPGCGHHLACAYANKQRMFHRISED